MPEKIGENFQKMCISSLFLSYLEQDEFEITVPF